MLWLNNTEKAINHCSYLNSCSFCDETNNLDEDIKNTVDKCPVKMVSKVCRAYKIKRKGNDPAAKPSCDRRMIEG